MINKWQIILNSGIQFSFLVLVFFCISSPLLGAEESTETPDKVTYTLHHFDLERGWRSEERGSLNHVIYQALELVEHQTNRVTRTVNGHLRLDLPHDQLIECSEEYSRAYSCHYRLKTLQTKTFESGGSSRHDRPHRFRREMAKVLYIGLRELYEKKYSLGLKEGVWSFDSNGPAISFGFNGGLFQLNPRYGEDVFSCYCSEGGSCGWERPETAFRCDFKVEGVATDPDLGAKLLSAIENHDRFSKEYNQMKDYFKSISGSETVRVANFPVYVSSSGQFVLTLFSGDENNYSRRMLEIHGWFYLDSDDEPYLYRFSPADYRGLEYRFDHF